MTRMNFYYHFFLPTNSVFSREKTLNYINKQVGKTRISRRKVYKVYTLTKTKVLYGRF